MASSFSHFIFVSLLFLNIYLFQLSFQQTLCHNEERLALLQLKESFVIEKHASGNPFTSPKFNLWKSQGIDCCSWEGVWCDQYTGYVISLDLSSSCLFGSINSSSSLFRLGHLQYLNLAFNDFNYSEIPAALGNLSRLTYLNLSASLFSGQIPLEISKLSELSVFDLSYNFDYSNQRLLELKSTDFKSLMQNLTKLEYLHLSYVKINSSIPDAMANLSSLTSLHLRHCGLFGKFLTAIFHLPKLEYLSVEFNGDLSGSLPEFPFHNQLRILEVSHTSFSGELPVSIGRLGSLEVLNASSCNFSGLIPPSIGNLTKFLTLALHNNSFRGEKVSFFSNLSQLTEITLSFNQFTFSDISSFAGLSHLRRLDLCSNQISASFPSWLTNLTELRYLNLGANMFQGPLPSSISRLKNLEAFIIEFNNLSGVLMLDTILELRYLKYLALSSNKFSVVIDTRNITNTTFPKLREVTLGSCNLREFPGFLYDQDELEVLDLSSNDVYGQIPNWIWKLSESLWYLDLSHNSLTNFEKSPFFLPSSILYLDLSFNTLETSLPIPPLNIIFYLASKNRFNGQIPPQICNLTFLQVFDLSYNNLSGTIPQCLGNSSKSLIVLNLQENNFHGPIPESWAAGNKIKAIQLGQNNLQGKLPRSLTNCRMLEFLDIGNNQIKDTFPSWLGTLPKLKILILRCNGFYGAIAIRNQESDILFPQLRIIDLSHNGLVGPLPANYFKGWNGMADFDEKNRTYLHAYDNTMVNGYILPIQYPYSMTITNKGNKLDYMKILEVFTAIDLSCNKFEGEILEAVGNLKGLQLLNFSNNILVGAIPPALGYLTNIEALDLSQNKLTGRIPVQLTQLNFLEVFNVSNNRLTGSIPQGRQFNTFENSSFAGNSGLCGVPLSKKCDDSKSKILPPPSSDSGLFAHFGWKAVLLGYGCGFLLGVIIGSIVFTRRHEWVMKNFQVRQYTTRNWV
ncbi:hypothetical protein SLA2020_241820 [Shorea laevis]